MENLFLIFLKPYTSAIFLGTHSLVEVLNKFHITPLSSLVNLYDLEFIAIYSAIYTIIVLFIIVIQIIASFSLSKKFALYSAIFWITPALLQITNLYDFSINKQIIFHVGGAIQNNVDGIFINAFFVIIFVWSLMTLFIHIFKLGKKSKVFYDHIWYIIGLSAIIFFISEHDSKVNQENIQIQENQLSKAFVILNTSLKNIDNLCENISFKKEFTTICDWNTPAKNYIRTFSESINFILLTKDIPSYIKITTLFGTKELNHDLLIQIDKLNNLCNKSNNRICLEIPIELNQDRRLFLGELSPFKKYIIPIEPLMPFISQQWEKYLLEKQRLEENKLLPFKQWIYFMLLSLFIGIKLAFTSREIFPVLENSIYRNFFKTLLSKIITCKNS